VSGCSHRDEPEAPKVRPKIVTEIVEFKVETPHFYKFLETYKNNKKLYFGVKGAPTDFQNYQDYVQIDVFYQGFPKETLKEDFSLKFRVEFKNGVTKTIFLKAPYLTESRLKDLQRMRQVFKETFITYEETRCFQILKKDVAALKGAVSISYVIKNPVEKIQGTFSKKELKRLQENLDKIIAFKPRAPLDVREVEKGARAVREIMKKVLDESYGKESVAKNRSERFTVPRQKS
jgi:hypothetical protein